MEVTMCKSLRLKNPKWYPQEVASHIFQIRREQSGRSSVAIVPARVLYKAEVDPARELYGAWEIVDDKILFQISYTKRNVFYEHKLIRSSLSGSRRVYIPAKVIERILGNKKEGYFTWKVVKGSTLTLCEVNTNVYLSQRLEGEVYYDEVSRKIKLPISLNMRRAIVCVDDEVVLLVPNDTYGLPMDKEEITVESVYRNRLDCLKNLSDCWLGYIDLDGFLCTEHSIRTVKGPYGDLSVCLVFLTTLESSNR